MGILNSIYRIRENLDKHPKIEAHRAALFWMNTKEGEKIRRRVLNDLESEKKLNFLKPKESIKELMLKLSTSEKIDIIVNGFLMKRFYRFQHKIRGFVSKVLGFVLITTFLLIIIFGLSGHYWFLVVSLLFFIIFIILYKKDFFVLPLIKLGMPIPVFRNLSVTKPKLNDVIEYLDEVIGLYKSNDFDPVNNDPRFLLKFAYAYDLFLGSGYSLTHDMMKECPTSKFKASALKILLYEIETKLELIDELDNYEKRKEIVIEFLEDIKEKLDADDWLGLGEVSKRINNYRDKKIGKQLESTKKLHIQYFDESFDIFEYEDPKKNKRNRNKVIIIAFSIVLGNIYIWRDSIIQFIQKELFIIFFVIPMVLLVLWLMWLIYNKKIKLKESQKKQGKEILRMVIGKYRPKF